MSNNIIFSAEYKNSATGHSFNFEVFEDGTILAGGSVFEHIKENNVDDVLFDKLETLRGEPYLTWVCTNYEEF